MDRPAVRWLASAAVAGLSRGRAAIGCPASAPTLGEHNIPVLQDILGLSQTEIDKLAAAGIIGTRAVPPNLRKARAAVG